MAHSLLTENGFTKDKLSTYLSTNAWNIPNIDETSEQTLGDYTLTGSSATLNFRHYQFVTLPTTEKFYIITALEVNEVGGADGVYVCGVDLVDASPPIINSTPLVALTREVSHVGGDINVKTSVLFSRVLRGGVLIGIWFHPSVTGSLRCSADSAKQLKSITYSSTPNFANATAWSTSTPKPKIRVYFRGYS